MPEQSLLYDRQTLLCEIHELTRGPRETIKSRTGATIGTKTAVSLVAPIAPTVGSDHFRYEICEGGTRRSNIVFGEIKPCERGFTCTGYLFQ
jgi:hypothetical protein